MLEIYKFALSQGKILSDRLIEAFASSDVVLEATCAAILGLVDPDEVIKALPKVVKSSNDYIRVMKNANFYLQKIEYDYTYPCCRYFKTEEEAKKFVETHDYDYNTSSNHAKDGYPYKGEYTQKSSGSCSFDEWYLCVPVEE